LRGEDGGDVQDIVYTPVKHLDEGESSGDEGTTEDEDQDGDIDQDDRVLRKAKKVPLSG
jgi:hypothetical protein